MTVEELIKELKKLPPEAIVTVGTDEDGIDFLLATKVSIGWWENRRPFGHFHEEIDVLEFPEEWQPTEDSPRAVCIARRP